MKMTQQYLDENMQIALRFQCPDGGLFWDYDTYGNLESHVDMMKRNGYSFKGWEACKSQPNKCVRNFLNFVTYNYRHNILFVSCTWYEVLSAALDAECVV